MPKNYSLLTNQNRLQKHYSLLTNEKFATAATEVKLLTNQETRSDGFVSTARFKARSLLTSCRWLSRANDRCIGGFHADLTWQGSGLLFCLRNMYTRRVLLANWSKSHKSCCLICVFFVTGVGMNLSPFVSTLIWLFVVSTLIWLFVSSSFERFFMCFLLAVIVIVERFWRLTFLRSLRLLVASRLAFKICFLAPCLWWESENTHVYFWTSLLSTAPNFSIILLNWAICAWRSTAICFTAPIVTSLFSACAARAGSIVVQFLGFSAVAGVVRLPFLISALKRPMSRWWRRIIALSVSCSAFLRICFISLLKSSPYIVGFLGKFACLCAFLKIWLHLRLG